MSLVHAFHWIPVFSPATVISPKNHTHLYPDVALTGRANGRSPRTLQKAMLLLSLFYRMWSWDPAGGRAPHQDGQSVADWVRPRVKGL